METENFPAWLKAQKGVPRDVKAWMRVSYRKLVKAKAQANMRPKSFDLAVELLRAIAQSYIDGTQDITFAYLADYALKGYLSGTGEWPK